MSDWQSETIHEKLARLRRQLKEAQDGLIEAEADLADQLADVKILELEMEARLGPLIDQLSALEVEVGTYNLRMQRMRNKEAFGTDHISVEEQYRRTWDVPRQAAAEPPPEPLNAADEKQIKRLYRRLARRFHPDLAKSEAERAYRTEKMAAVNDAYTARSLAELVALDLEPTPAGFGERPDEQTSEQMIAALEEEIKRVKRRMRQIRFEMDNLHNRESVRLSLEMKLAGEEGRDVIAEMERELLRKVARKEAERDFLRTQFDQLGPEAYIGPAR